MVYIGFWRRFAAYIIDALIIYVIEIPINLLFGPHATTQINGSQVSVSTNSGMSGLVILLSLVIAVLYWVVLQNKMGQTFGKKVMGIKVVDTQGKTPNMMTLFLREIIGKLVSAIILFIGFLMVVWDGKKQALHDKIASTYVVKA